ncbi:MAG: DinB family protein [bacterium]|nr:DinB family protein [bacterium]
MTVFSNQASGASEEAEAYITAVLQLLGERDPLTVLRSTAADLRRAVSDRKPDELRRPEGVGKWSALQVIQHLADSDLVWAYRIRLVIAEDRPELRGFDQDLWAQGLRYRDGETRRALEQFEVLRELNLELLDGLDPATFERVGIHSERGEESLALMVRLYAGHDLVHLRQLARILAAGDSGS